jgi:hypothetical protein
LHDAFLDISELQDKDYVDLLKDAFNMRRGKWDWALSDDLLRKSFISAHLTFEGARRTAEEIVQSSAH